MKTIYAPDEWVRHKVEENRWFTFERQDQLMLHMAFEIYMETEDRSTKTFKDALDEAKHLLRLFYNDRYNPQTRTGR